MLLYIENRTLQRKIPNVAIMYSLSKVSNGMNNYLNMRKINFSLICNLHNLNIITNKSEEDRPSDEHKRIQDTFWSDKHNQSKLINEYPKKHPHP